MILLDEAPHLEQRKLLLPAFHGEKMKRLTGLMTELAEREVQSWPTGQPVALHSKLQRVTLEIILRAVFGLEQGQRLDDLRESVTEVLGFSESPLSVLPAAERWARLSGTFRRFRAARKRADELIFAEIEERRAASDDDGNDVLAMLLAARHEDGSPMSPRELRDELMTSLVAGHETTASQLAWGFERLSREPHVVARLTEELDAGEQDDYLTATVYEILRLRPVLPNAEPRLTKKPVTIGGFEYPAGVALLASAWLVHHDPDIYSEPYEMRPERFLDKAPGHLHLDPLRRRPPALPRRKLRAPGDEDRDARGAEPLRAGRGRPAARADRAPEHHVQPHRRRHRDPPRANARATRGRARRAARQRLNPARSGS